MVWEFEKEVEAIKKSVGDISFQDQRVLITGGAGFLGAALANRLVAAGHVVRVLDDLSNGDAGRLDGATTEQPVSSLFTGKPDPINSAPLRELDGFKVGDAGDVPGARRTVMSSVHSMT